jgi:flagellar basal-body rod modification protein FlgD
MSIPATEAVIPTGMYQSPAAATPGSSSDKEMFLNLMVAQLRYQDPLNPTDSGEFLAQNAQFTALEKMQDVADQTARLLSAQMAFGASGLVGKQVTWTDSDGAIQSGTVKGVTFGADGPVLEAGGRSFAIASLLSVNDGSTTTDGTTNSTTSA